MGKVLIALTQHFKNITMRYIIFRPLILLILCCITVPVLAQVTGKVTDNTGKALAGATVSLLQATDSSLIKQTVSGADGSFQMVPSKNSLYLISVRSAGFKIYYSLPFSADSLSVSTPLAILLQAEKAKTLDAVSVTAKKPMIERKADKTIVNVDVFISNAGSNALEVLEKSPGVQVDNNDVISLKGKPGVTIYIDDRPSYLSGAELAAYLKSLPASTLDKIEIMTTPPAKYDAAGNAGIINIKTKKNKLKGYSGNLNSSYRQGKYGDSRNTFSFNYRNNKINLFSTSSFSGGTNFNDLDISRKYLDAGGNLASGFAQNSYIKRWYNSLNVKLGADYALNRKTNLGIVLNTAWRPSTERRKNKGIFSDAQSIPDSVILADNYEKEKFTNSSVNLNFIYKPDSIGNELSMDADYIRYKTTTNQLFKNSSYDNAAFLKTKDDLIGMLPSYIDIYSFKADYVHPLNKTSKLETGIKTSYITTNNIASYLTVLNNITAADYDKSNHFIYSENINAVYANYSTDLKRLAVQLGLRAENTISKGHQLGNALKPDSSFKKNYTNLFPTAFLSYKADSTGNNLLTFSYSKRIDRPYYADLNPFISPLDKFTYYAGNPFLKPQFTQHFELGYAYKSAVSIAFLYDHIRDEMDETIELNGNTFISRTGNIGKKDAAGVSVDATIKPTKWWTILPYVQYLYQHTRSQIYTEKVDTKAGFYSASVINQLNLTKGWSMEVTGRYRSSILDGQFHTVAYGQMNIGAQKKILKDKASLKMNILDIFKTRINAGYINSLKGGSGYYHNLSDSRAVVLAFTYRFNKGTKSSEARKTGGAENEQSRVKN
jgi:hypothetical protein